VFDGERNYEMVVYMRKRGVESSAMITKTAQRHFESEPSPIQDLTFFSVAPLFEARSLAFGEAQQQTLKLRDA
jgi:hypothetical protein